VLVTLYVHSPGLQAGLRAGDIVTAIDGVPVHSAQDTLTRVAAHKPGSTVAIKVVRGNTTVAVKAAVTERPPPS